MQTHKRAIDKEKIVTIKRSIEHTRHRMATDCFHSGRHTGGPEISHSARLPSAQDTQVDVGERKKELPDGLSEEMSKIWENF